MLICPTLFIEFGDNIVLFCDEKKKKVFSFLVRVSLSLSLSFRLYNYEPLTPLKSLRANLYGKFVAVRGTVVRVSNIKPLCSKLAFACNSCGDTQSVTLPDGKYTIPTKVQCAFS